MLPVGPIPTGFPHAGRWLNRRESAARGGSKAIPIIPPEAKLSKQDFAPVSRPVLRTSPEAVTTDFTTPAVPVPVTQLAGAGQALAEAARTACAVLAGTRHRMA